MELLFFFFMQIVTAFKIYIYYALYLSMQIIFAVYSYMKIFTPVLFCLLCPLSAGEFWTGQFLNNFWITVLTSKSIHYTTMSGQMQNRAKPSTSVEGRKIHGTKYMLPCMHTCTIVRHLIKSYFWVINTCIYFNFLHLCQFSQQPIWQSVQQKNQLCLKWQKIKFFVS